MGLNMTGESGSSLAHWPVWKIEGIAYASTFSVVLTGFLAYAILCLLYRRFFSPLCDVPGPFLASICRLWHVKILHSGKHNLALASMHEKHGDFVRISHNEVSVSHPDAVKSVLSATIDKGHFYQMSAFPDWRYQNPFCTTDAKTKIAMSKNFAAGYTLSNALLAEESMNGVISGLWGWMDQFAARGEPIDLGQYITFATFDILGEALFSKPFGYLKAGKDIGGSLKTTNDLVAVGGIISQYEALQWIFINPVVAKLMPWGLMFDTAHEAIQERKKNPDARFDIIAHWLRTMREHPERLSERQLLSHLTINVSAGSDTVSCASQATLYYMLRCPSTWQKVSEEIRSAQSQGHCSGTTVSYADTQKLRYLQACIKEAMRVFAPVSMGLPRVAPKGGLRVADKVFPEGTTISVSPWVIHRSKTIWGSDADEFKPERWLVPDVASLERNWIPFGTGYAGCPGQTYAKMEISKIVATIVRDYDVRLADPSREWQWSAYFTMVPHSWPVYVSKRSI